MQAYSLGVVAHVLRAVKGFEGQAIQEVPWVQQPCHWPYLPPGVLPAGDADASFVRDVSGSWVWNMSDGTCRMGGGSANRLCLSPAVLPAWDARARELDESCVRPLCVHTSDGRTGQIYHHVVALKALQVLREIRRALCQDLSVWHLSAANP